jgi:hypothetical protein
MKIIFHRGWLRARLARSLSTSSAIFATTACLDRHNRVLPAPLPNLLTVAVHGVRKPFIYNGFINFEYR